MVALIFNFRTIKNIFDWEVGIHGLRIKFKKDGVIYEGSYMPEVPVSMNWDHQKSVDRLIKKSGFSPGLEKMKLEDWIYITIFERDEFSMTYDEYVSAFE